MHKKDPLIPLMTCAKQLKGILCVYYNFSSECSSAFNKGVYTV